METCKCYKEAWEITGWLGPDEVIRKRRTRCNGTREQDECSCGGDRTKCDFYPEVREKAKKELKENKIISGVPIDRGCLSDWYISSVSKNDLPVWTEEHLEELFNDFYLIPKEN